MTRQRRPRTAEPPAPIDDWENLKSVSRVDAANGYAWDFGLVFVVYVVLRGIGVIRAALRRPGPLTPALRSTPDRHEHEGT
ncbi:MAG: hypothetical protein M3R57_09310 [Chloroflexota bacterium]|nr:hypothetical protein [Chloroflexota bacterium]